MIAAKNRGIPIRLISDPQQYRDATRLWDAWNIDRMYVAGIPIKMRAHQGLNHEKLVMLYSQSMAMVAYNTSKAAVVNFTRTLAGEWGKYNINVNALAPGML